MYDMEQASELAVLWIRRIEGNTSVDEGIDQSVVLLSFLATPGVQWAFIIAALNEAKDDSALGHLAAGPVERLLGKHGNDLLIEWNCILASRPSSSG